MKNILDKTAARGINEAEIYYLDSIKEEIKFENDMLKAVSTSQNSGAALRFVKDGRMGHVASSNLDDIDRIVDNALEVSNFSPLKEFDFAKNSKLQAKDYGSPKIWDIPMEKLIEDGRRAVEIIKKHDPEVQVSASFAKIRDNVRVLNSNGVDVECRKNRFSAAVVCKLIKETSFIEVGKADNNLTGKYDIEAFAEESIRQLELSKKDFTVGTGKMPVILSPLAVSEVLLTLQLGVNGLMVERGISPLKGKIGERMLSEKFTLIDDGTWDNGDSSMAFDDEGTPSQKTVLFQNGILKSYLHSLKTAAKLGFEPTGNGLRQQQLFVSKKYDANPAPDTTNLIMEGGKVKLDDMIKDIHQGVIIDHIMGIFMNNLLNGDFAGSIGQGYLIKDGKTVGRLKNAAINENIYNIFLNNIVELCDMPERTAFLGSIGSHLFPYVMLKDINIAGKK